MFKRALEVAASDFIMCYGGSPRFGQNPPGAGAAGDPARMTIDEALDVPGFTRSPTSFRRMCR